MANYYEVSFKCSLKIYLSVQEFEVGNMVIVSTSGGSNIGFISRQVDESEIQQLNLLGLGQGIIPAKKILSAVKDADETIRNILQTKMINESKAFEKCQMISRGHHSCQNFEILATELQFDNKKLSVYLKKSGDSSVCRFVHKLFKYFKMKIKVVEVPHPHILEEAASKYLSLSNLDSSVVVANTLQSPASGNFHSAPHSACSNAAISVVNRESLPPDLHHSPLYQRARSGTFPTMMRTIDNGNGSYNHEQPFLSATQPIRLGPAVRAHKTHPESFSHFNYIGQELLYQNQLEEQGPYFHESWHG